MHSYNQRVEVYKNAVFSTILRLHPNLNCVIYGYAEVEVDGRDGVVLGVMQHVQNLRMAVVQIASSANIIP